MRVTLIFESTKSVQKELFKHFHPGRLFSPGTFDFCPISGCSKRNRKRWNKMARSTGFSAWMRDKIWIPFHLRPGSLVATQGTAAKISSAA